MQSRSEPEFPWRVLAIAVSLFALLGLVGWLIFGPDDIPATAGAGSAALIEPTADGRLPEATAPPTTTLGGNSAPTGSAAPPESPTLDPTEPETRAALAATRYSAGTMDVRLFLIVPSIERLIPVPRTIAAPATIDGQAQSTIEELINWSSSETVSPLPPEAGVREVWVSPGGIAYVDFDQAFSDFAGSGALGELQAVYGVVTTLAVSFPEIYAVQILIEGERIETLAGHVDLSRPLLPSDEWALIERLETPFQESNGG